MAKRKKRKSHEPEVLDKEPSKPSDGGLSPEDIALGVMVDDQQIVSSDWPELEESGSRAISPLDPLKQYMEEVKRYPLIPPEEEYQLAKKLHEEGDLDAAKQLVQANLRLVVKIAFEYHNIYNNLMDLIQEGNVGLMKAVSKYDPYKGAKLSYYSSWWIRSYILKYILDNFRLVKVGTTQAQKKLFFHLMREKQKLEAQGLTAAPKLLADKLDVKESEVREMDQRLSGSGAEASIDMPLKSDGDGRSSALKDLLPNEDEGVDLHLAHQQALDILKKALPRFKEGLNQKEQQILTQRVLAESPKTLQEIADEHGLTRERVRQIESKIITKLREFLRSDGSLDLSLEGEKPPKSSS